MENVKSKTVFSKNQLQGINWYTILANPSYANQFNYISSSIPNRNLLITDTEQSDMVQLILNLGLIDDELAKKMVFGHGLV